MTVKIRVRDFQSIEDAEIEVSGLTVITGANNTGKSASLRAVFGLFTNARGTKFVRHGKDQCSVSVTFGDGRSVTWEKGAKQNRYTVDGKVLDKVGAGVPPEVEALGVVPITASGRELWPQFAQQFTGQVFLLDQPGSVLAESIADVSRVGVLNEALRLSQSDRRSLTSELKVRLSDVSRLEGVEAGYAGLDRVEEKVAELATLKTETDTLKERAEGVRSLRDNLRTLSDTVEEFVPVRWVEIPDGGSEIGDNLSLLIELLSVREKLGPLADTVRTLGPVSGVTLPDDSDVLRPGKVLEALSLLLGFQENRRALSEVTGRGSEIRSAVSAPLPDPEEVRRVSSGLEELRRLRTDWGSRKKTLADLRSEVLSLSESYEGALHEVRDLVGESGECPICGTR